MCQTEWSPILGTLWCINKWQYTVVVWHLFSPWEVQQTWYRQQTVIWCTAFWTECDNFPRLYHDLIVPIIYNVSSSAVINFKVLSTNLAKCVIFAIVRRRYERNLLTVSAYDFSTPCFKIVIDKRMGVLSICSDSFAKHFSEAVNSRKLFYTLTNREIGVFYKKSELADLGLEIGVTPPKAEKLAAMPV